MSHAKVDAVNLRPFLVSSLAVLVLAGCLDTVDEPHAGPASNNTSTSNNASNNATNNHGGSNNEGSNNRQPGRIASLSISPETVTLTSLNASQPTQAFVLTGTDDTGAMEHNLSAFWEIDTVQVGRIGERDGVFTANGLVGGTATIKATSDRAPGLAATATVRVLIKREMLADGATPDAATSFQNATIVDDPMRAAGLLYPLQGAVMPQNVYPADIQWERGVQGDHFRIMLQTRNATVTAYATHTGDGFGNHWLVEENAWRALAQTDTGTPVTITVDRYEAATGEVVAGEPITMTFANAALSGSVYYWDIAAGRIVRIDDGSGTRNEFMPAPPPSPNGERCVGCHAVSNDGRYMVGRLGGGFNAGAIFDLTKDLTVDPAPTEYAVSASSPYWNFATWSPDNTRLVVSGNEWAGEGMKLVDPFAGVEVPVVAGPLPGGGTTHPAWSPNGQLLAYVENAGGFGGANVTGDIAVMDVVGQDAFANARRIVQGTSVAGAVPAGNAASYPTWTPDSSFLAFAHGTGSRSENQASALYMVYPDGTNLVRLDNASGGPTATDTFQPKFSPFDQGGYFWVSVLSRRDYGNAEVGTKGSGLQQIWVSAVSTNPQPGQDPSEVGYWLPGQNPKSRNISAFWAPRACRMDGEGCAVGSECCSGECLPDGNDTLVCSPPPPERCRAIGESCNQESDCCDGDSPNVVCVQNSCTRVEN